MSVIVTTVVATLLTAAHGFSLAAVVALDVLVTVAGLLARGLPSMREAPARTRLLRGQGGTLGVAVFVAALAAYWPAYPNFFAAGDSTAYVDTGVWLARSGGLSKHDDLGPTLAPMLRASLFDSMAQVPGGGPPYRRMPGAMMLRSLDSDTAWPAFFPVPAIWAALCTSVLGTRHAVAYATLFAALGAWAFFLLATRWLGPVLGLFAMLLAAANGATYWTARSALSEPLAWFFMFCGLTAVAAYRDEARNGPANHSSAILAGAAFGMAIATRVDMALFLAGAFLLLPSLRESSQRRYLPRSFLLALAAGASLLVVEMIALPGSYVDPLTDSLRGLRLALLFDYQSNALAVIAATAAAVAVGVAAVAWLGVARAVRFGLLAGFLGAHAMAANFLPTRTPMWLSFYVGWGGMALAAFGALRLHRRKLPGSSFLLALLGAVCLVLFYNPHVFPGLPWGSRRFVPVLIPAAILTASVGVAVAWQWKRAAGLAVATALAVSVAAGGAPVWGQPLFPDAPEQLDAFASKLPDDGVVLISRSVSSYMLGAALWLLYDRNSVAVYPESTAAGRREIASMVWGLDKPVYYVTNALEEPIRIPGVGRTEIGRVNFALRLLEQTYDRRPERRERYITPVAIFRLTRTLDRRGATLQSR